MTANTLLLALGIALIIEGVIPALFPNRWLNYVKKLAREPSIKIRQVGYSLLICGLFIVWGAS